MPDKSRGWRLVIFTLALWAAIAVPYIVVNANAPDGQVFAGFLLNPLDGNTYLAKMYQGWAGNWQFHLPFTAEEGRGYYLYTFYLFLGHLARWTGLPLILVYHAARLICAAFLVLALDGLIRSLLDDRKAIVFCLSLVVFGSGLGWLFLLSGSFTPDFWVAEIYPFLSSYANPHFPFSLALMAWLLNPNTVNKRRSGYGLLKTASGLVLTSLAPFGAVIVGLVWMVTWVYDIVMRSDRTVLQDEARHLAWFVLGAVPMAVYILWVTRSDPLLAGWNSQNITPTPPFWQVVVALSPALMAAIIGAASMLTGGDPKTRHILVWAALGLILIYLPVSIQRRFMLGLFVPLSILAGIGLKAISKNMRRFKLAMVILVAFSLPTNLIVILAGLQGGATNDSLLFLSRDEDAALQWLADETPTDALVLASPAMGLFIPARSGRRVVYGHPYETIQAAEMKSAASAFFQNGGVLPEALSSLDIDYVFWGPRERSLGPSIDRTNLRPVYQSEGVSIYAWDWVR